jgi:hypothetical protein
VRDEIGSLEKLGGLRVRREGEQLLGQGIAGLGGVRELLPSSGPGEQLPPGGVGIERVLSHQGGEIALLQEHPGQPPEGRALAPAAQGLEGHPEIQGLEKHVVPVSEALAQPLLPGPGEEDVGLRLVGHPEPGDDSAIEGPLLQDGRAQGVDGRNVGPLQDLEGGAGTLPLLGLEGGVDPVRLEPLAEAQLHGRGRVLGEGHRRDLVEASRPGADQGIDAVDEEGGLARSGAGLDHQARPVVVARPLPRLLVDGTEAHTTSLRRR